MKKTATRSDPSSESAKVHTLGDASGADEVSRLTKWLQRGGSLGAILRLDGDKLNTLYCAGYRLFEEGRQKEALGIFGALAAFDPSEIRFHHAVATCLFRMGQFRQAAQSYLLLKLLQPDKPETLFRLAQCLLAEGERDSAADMLETVVGECSSSDSVWKTRAEALLRLLRTPAAAQGQGHDPTAQLAPPAAI